MKLNYKRTLLVGFAFFLISVFWQAYDSTVPLLLTNKFGILMDKMGMTVLFPYACIFAGLAFVTMSMVKHGDAKVEAKSGLDAFDIDD